MLSLLGERDPLLGGLLKSLSPEWDDAAIDQMLSTVDLSGDGQIQMQEFLQWILVCVCVTLELFRFRVITST